MQSFYFLSTRGIAGNKNNCKDNGTGVPENETPGTMDEPKEWKSYTSGEFNVNLNYPFNWKMEKHLPIPLPGPRGSG
jgi:hypothetical protein